MTRSAGRLPDVCREERWSFTTRVYSNSSPLVLQLELQILSLGIKTAQKPYIVWSLGPKALIYESLDP